MAIAVAANVLVAIVASCAALASAAQAPAAPCDKNHYILVTQKGHCEEWGPKDAIGPPGAIVADDEGNVYFSSPNIVYKILADGTVIRFAGTGMPGYSGDGGAALEATLNFPLMYPERVADPQRFGMLVGALAVAGEYVYIADAYNNRVRGVDRNGTITTIAGNGGKGSAYWDDGDYGPPAEARVTWPQGIAVDLRYGDLYIVSAYGQLRWIHRDARVILPLAWPNCGPGRAAPGLCAPGQIAVSHRDVALAASPVTLYVPDSYCRVRVLRPYPGGDVTTFAGLEAGAVPQGVPTCGYGGDGGAASEARLGRQPGAVAVDDAGNVFIADTDNHCIRRVEATRGIVSTALGVCGEASPGTATSPPSAVPVGAQRVRLDAPRGVAVDHAGNLYVADTNNQRVLKIDASGGVTTLAGRTVQGW